MDNRLKSSINWFDNTGSMGTKPLIARFISMRGFYIYKMASVYVIYSKNIDKYYTGSCKDLSYRINQHLNKEYFESFTARANDWILFWHFDDLNYDQARKVEAHIKRMKSKMFIQNLKKYPDIILKLKQKYA